MLTIPTVFVLGAGASAPFNFPTGQQLSKLMVAQLSEGGACFDVLQRLCNFSKDEIISFRDAFRFSGKNSVDAFLEHRTEFIGIGKAATAAVLIGFETNDALFRYEDNWLRYLFDRLNASFSDFGKNQISILTFNYDRTVEHFLFTCLQNTYGQSDADCSDALGKIPIIHLHGRLGFLPWQSPRESAATSFHHYPSS